MAMPSMCRLCWATPLLVRDEEGKLEAGTVLEELEQRHPGEYGPDKLRTLQRRMKEWRALQGPPRPVYFPQEHEPGREAAVDFTDCGVLGVRGEALQRHDAGARRRGEGGGVDPCRRDEGRVGEGAQLGLVLAQPAHHPCRPFRAHLGDAAVPVEALRADPEDQLL